MVRAARPITGKFGSMSPYQVRSLLRGLSRLFGNRTPQFAGGAKPVGVEVREPKLKEVTIPVSPSDPHYAGPDNFRALVDPVIGTKFKDLRHPLHPEATKEDVYKWALSGKIPKKHARILVHKDPFRYAAIHKLPLETALHARAFQIGEGGPFVHPEQYEALSREYHAIIGTHVPSNIIRSLVLQRHPELEGHLRRRSLIETMIGSLASKYEKFKSWVSDIRARRVVEIAKWIKPTIVQAFRNAWFHRYGDIDPDLHWKKYGVE